MKKTTSLVPLIARSMAPAAAVTSALVSPAALGAAGDLDPSFGDVGRLGPILDGPAWSLEPQSDGTILLGGGSPGFFYWGAWYGNPSYVRLVSDAGALDPAFAARNLDTVQIVQATRQPDGFVIGVGRQLIYGDQDTRLVVVRLRPDGTRDPGFGTNGEFRLAPADHGFHQDATSVVLEPDGRIVVAGSRDEKLIVLRLMPDGSLDQSFAAMGIFEGPANVDHSNGQSGAWTNILRTSAGGYRVTTAASEGCQVVALTADGSIDASFGTAGIATVVTAAGPTTYCSDMDDQPDGRLLVAGARNDRGFVARLLANGQPDPAFAAADVSATMTRATAVAADGDEAVVVAGVGDKGMTIQRLDSGGGLDAAFGVEGITTFDIDMIGPAYPVVYDLFVGADRKVVGAGGVCQPEDCWWSDQAFVVRLLGAGGASPGVLGISEQNDIEVAEGDGEAVLNVRRTGGRSGSVSVSWKTSALDWSNAATPGKDYQAVSGTLTWADGDATEKQIRVPIFADQAVEDYEYLEVELSGGQIGAGFGKRRAMIAIAADGSPHGQFGFPDEYINAYRENAPISIPVSRDYYSTGVVSVTLTPKSGTAIAGDDFIADPVTVTWQDGELGWKEIEIPIVDDSLAEITETFTIELSNPTGGAVIGPRQSMTVYIATNDQPRPPPVSRSDSGGGGGAFGAFSLLMLGSLRLLRRTFNACRLKGVS